MRIGTDGKKLPEATQRGPLGSLELGKQLGAEGLFFRRVLDMSPNLDTQVLQTIRHRADELEMYIESGLDTVNPYNTAETPELRAIGDGDVLLGFRRMLEACAGIGIREVWAQTASYKSKYIGRLAYDRFRTDVSWSDQLGATQKFLAKLAPFARDLGIHINLETHEEITSFELVRLVEAIGPDVLGVTFDTANVLQRIEHPVWAAKRLAPYVRQTHIKDGAVTRGPGGLSFQMRNLGTGAVNFPEILPILAAANPTLNLSYENQGVRDAPFTQRMVIEIDDPEFLAAHPDLSPEEYAAYMEMVDDYDKLISSGEQPDWETVAQEPLDFRSVTQEISNGLRYLRRVCQSAGLPLGALASEPV